jgi:hypothetical protein
MSNEGLDGCVIEGPGSSMQLWFELLNTLNSQMFVSQSALSSAMSSLLA